MNAYRIQRRARPCRWRRAAVHGFTLIEVALTLIVLGLLGRAVLRPLGAVIERDRRAAVEAQLAAAREALAGFVIANGHLPCPATDAPAVPEEQPRNGVCRRQHGRLPSAVLGLGAQRNAAGAVLDPWGQQLYYALSLASHAERGDPAVPDWTDANEIVTVGARHLSADLEICRRSSTGDCPDRDRMADGIVAVILSYGADRSAVGAQAENQDEDRTFVLMPPSVNVDQAFDDHLLWLSRSEMSYWLLRSEWLP